MDNEPRKVRKRSGAMAAKQEAKAKKPTKALSQGQKRAIIAIVLILMGMILILSMYTGAGTVGIGHGIRLFFKGLLGDMAYLLPVVILGISVHILFRKNKEESYWMHYTATTVLLWMLSAADHLAQWGIVGQYPHIGSCFKAGTDGVGGGLLGGGFVMLLCRTFRFHPTLAWVIVLAIAAITLVVLTKFTLTRKLGGKLYTWLKGCWDEEREIRRIEKEEKTDDRIKRKREPAVIPVSVEGEPQADKGTQHTTQTFPKKEEPLEEGPEIITAGGEPNKKTPNKTEYDPFHDRDLEDKPKPEPKKTPEKEPAEIPVYEGVQQDWNGVPREEEEDTDTLMPYRYPTCDILEPIKKDQSRQSPEQLRELAGRLIETLSSFGVEARVLEIRQGPTVTQFELAPEPGVRVNRFTGLADDIALALAARSVRVEAPIPGKAAVGIEIPNESISVVFLREVLESPTFLNNRSKLTFAVGKDITGNCVVGDIAKMPHMLIAGQTGSGKSVCLNCLIASILFKASPEEVKMIMIDPKVVELGVYNGIPHLMIPVVTDAKKAANALNWAVSEMESRYKMFENYGARNIQGYNEKAVKEGFAPMPQIVIIIDELADLMMVARKNVEESICRLAQLARAAGMHLVVATQRPSVDVITGLIKANIPSRIAFSVASYVDSRTILDCNGAEKLLGRGDMLYHPSGSPKPVRIQGAYISDPDIEKLVDYVKEGQETIYDEDVIAKIETLLPETEEEEEADDADELLSKAVEIVVEAGQASTSYIQRRLKVGYSRAGRIMDQMEKRGIVGPPDGSKPREVLITPEEMYQMMITSNDEENI